MDSSACPSDLSSDSDEGSPGIRAQYGGADAGVGFVNPPEYDGIEMKSFARLDPPDGVVREASYSSKTDSPRVVFKGILRGAAELTSGRGYVDLDTQDASGYRTVSSLDSLDGREASPQNQGEETLNYGVIKFGEESGQAAKIRPFITTTADSTVDEIAQWMAGKWRMRSPKVILSVVSGVQHNTIFHNSKFSEDFQKGLTKAANSSVMWVLTDGVDFGAPKLIGDAIAEEMGRRKMVESDVTVRNADKLPKLTLIGVSKKELVTPNARRGSVESMTRNKALNPDHTHFILSDSCSDRGNWVEFHNRVEERFLKPVGRPRKYRRVTSGSDAPDNVDGVINTTPLVGMVLQGGLEEIDHTLCLLRRRNPVLVIKGSGYAADLIAFAHEGLDERRDADFVSTSLKPELMRKVGNAFPSELADNDALRTLYRDRILECVALGLQDGQTFLTVVDVTQWDTDLTQLSKYILTAIFKSEKQSSGKQLVEHILRDLQLTLDWNLCDLAESVIFEKYVRKKIKVENYLFEQALLRKDREEFVDLFLRYGFRVHKYLNHKRLKHLFENAHDKDLFYGVCMQKILGQIVDPNNILGNSFLEENACQLNRLLFRCTKLRNLVNPYELSMNCLGSYVTNVDVAERKALNTLVLWAAVTHKTKLCKMLWKKVDDPIPMALLLSNLFHSLSKNCLDRDLRSQLKQHSADFGKMAVEILDLSYSDSPTQALDILSKKLPDFDNRTAMELAYIGNNRYFISHKCCQRWLNQRWNGMLLFREMDWGIFSIPQWLKIYLCAFLVFPMYIWLSFLPTPQDHAETLIEVEAEDDYPEKAEKDFLLEHLKSIKERHKHKPVKWRQGLDSLKNVMVLGQTYRPSLSRQIFYLWSAPITKFWIAQLFYLAYLLLFTFALILPTCGNIILDLSVFTWTAIILAELIRFTIIKKQRYPEMPIVYRCFEILLISTFLGFYLLTRIIPHFVTLTGMRYEFTDYQSAKFVMSLGLLFFYYRLLTDCLPISPTLGPMLINIMRMVKKDFSTWFRMFLVFLVSGAVTIHAVIYPNFPVSWEMFRFSFSRALFALFLTKIDDLERDDTCIDQHPNATLGFCSKDYSIPRESTCAYGGWVTYVVVIQYLFIVKLVLTTLLYAMFSTTIAAIKAESTQIWKFQRYTVIVEFEERLRLPPPVIVISYLLILLQALFWKCVSLQQFCIGCCRSRRRNLPDMVDSMKGHTRLQGIVHIKRTEDFNYWKKCVKVFCEKEDNLEKENNRPKQDTLLLQSLIEDMGNQKRYNRKLNDRLVHLEKGLTNCLLLMEEAKHMIGKLDPKMQAMSLSEKKQVHMYSRQSPYPSTTLDRFPVLDKFVTWENVHSAYDPCVFTKPVEEYPAAVQKFVDVDVLCAEKPLRGSDLHTGDGKDVTLSKSESEGIVTDSNQSGQTPRKPTRLKARWNAVYTIRVDSILVEVDRTSWISEDGRTCRYRLDRTDLPQNPRGRTGVRGRGVLWRWGPNHCILGVITRCKTVAQEGKSREVAMKEGKRVLEFVTVQTDEEQSFDFPGGVIHGLTSPYSLLCELFLKSVVMEEDVDSRVRLDKEDMVNFSADNRRNVDGDDVDSGFTAEVLYRGYLDDARNTDNAWLETEVWNFHYSEGEQLSVRFPKGKFKWQELSSQSPVHDNQLDILREVAKIHSSYY